MAILISFIDVITRVFFGYYMLDEKIDRIKSVGFAIVFTIIYAYVQRCYNNAVLLQIISNVIISILFMMFYFKKWDNKSIVLFLTIEVMYYFYQILFLLLTDLLDINVFYDIIFSLIKITFIIIFLRLTLKQVKDVFLGSERNNITILFLFDVFLFVVVFIALILPLDNNQYILMMISIIILIICIMISSLTVLKVSNIKYNQSNMEFFI